MLADVCWMQMESSMKSDFWADEFKGRYVSEEE
jgi:hypothetical protein